MFFRLFAKKSIFKSEAHPGIFKAGVSDRQANKSGQFYCIKEATC